MCVLVYIYIYISRSRFIQEQVGHCSVNIDTGNETNVLSTENIFMRKNYTRNMNGGHIYIHTLYVLAYLFTAQTG